MFANNKKISFQRFCKISKGGVIINLKTFCINQQIEYKETMISNPVINKFYEIHNPYGEQIVAIPDSCIDIEFVWQNGKMYSLLCGSLERGTVSQIGTYEYCFGIKFNPGMFPTTIRANINEIVNNRYNLYDFVCMDRMDNEIFRIASFEDKIEYFLNKFDCKINNSESKTITSYMISEINKSSGHINIIDLVNDIGYSHCYTDRVFKKVVGFSIKKYANIIRLQESIDILENNNMEEIYDRLGYYDQAHFIKDFKKFTLITPNVYTKIDKELKIV